MRHATFSRVKAGCATVADGETDGIVGDAGRNTGVVTRSGAARRLDPRHELRKVVRSRLQSGGDAVVRPVAQVLGRQVAVDALANFNRDRQEDAVHARAEGPERENVERELGEVLPVGLVARSSWRLGRLRVKSGKSVDQSVFVRVVRASFLPPHAVSTRQSSSSITHVCLGLPTRANVRPTRRKSCPERNAALGSCDRARTDPSPPPPLPPPRSDQHRRGAWKRRVEIIFNPNPPSSTVCARRAVVNPSTRLSRESSRPRFGRPGLASEPFR